MKTTLTIFVATFGCPGMAMAHVGHLGSLAGHDHTIAGIAIGAEAKKAGDDVGAWTRARASFTRACDHGVAAGCYELSIYCGLFFIADMPSAYNLDDDNGCKHSYITLQCGWMTGQRYSSSSSSCARTRYSSSTGSTKWARNS